MPFFFALLLWYNSFFIESVKLAYVSKVGNNSNQVSPMPEIYHALQNAISEKTALSHVGFVTFSRFRTMAFLNCFLHYFF